jgi:hypothetical protein
MYSWSKAQRKSGDMKSILILVLIMASVMSSLAMTWGSAENGEGGDYGHGPSSGGESGAAVPEQGNDNPQVDVVEQGCDALPPDAENSAAIESANKSAIPPVNKSAINITASTTSNNKTCNCTIVNQRLDRLESLLNAILGNLSLEKELKN